MQCKTIFSFLQSSAYKTFFLVFAKTQTVGTFFNESTFFSKNLLYLCKSCKKVKHERKLDCKGLEWGGGGGMQFLGMQNNAHKL